VERIQASTVVRQFKRTFEEQSVNRLGKATRLCRRERVATPFRLMLALIESFACAGLDSIADIHRTFNALCDTHMRYKPFHNQLAKPGFADFTREMLSRVLNELACEVLQFSAHSPFARFNQLRIQDGTSFALKPSLSDVYPGRFTTVSPAAVELHVDLDLFSETANRIVLSADTASERQFLPEPEELSGGLLLGDRGYFGKAYLQRLDQAGGHFIVRAMGDINPTIIKALRPDGSEIKAYRKQPLKAVKKRLARYECVDLLVEFATTSAPFQCRVVVHPNLRGDNTPRYLVTNLDLETFSAHLISDGYRLRWQIELLFKEWKSHANLHAFDTANPYIAEGLIWASLCAASVARYCAHVTERMTGVMISTRIVAKSIHHVLRAVLYDLMHHHRRLHTSVKRAIEYLSSNAPRAHPDRDRRTGRQKLGLIHVHAMPLKN
jgi:hypothetical protein